MYKKKKWREQCFEENLEKNQLVMIVRFRFSEDLKKIDSFSVSQLSRVFGELNEIIRYDASETEGVNVHEFFINKNKKRFFDKPKNADTVLWCMNRIRENWREFKHKFELKGKRIT